MIIKKLRLENFGVYAGSHEIDLSPTSRAKPIILFGGLNGGGKTTLLDAIQLALFGKLSRCSTRGTLSYDEFLRRSTSHNALPGAMSSVSLEIRQTFDAQNHDFKITRSWMSTAKSVTETLVVHRDDVIDAELADHWLEHVDQFVPVGLAELFFFDGEQIARLAEADNAAQMLGTAISTLLGIDMVDRLERDLTVYERDIARGQRDSEAVTAVTIQEEKLVATHEDLRQLLFEKGRMQNELDQSQKKMEMAEQSFRQQGGELFSRRKELTVQSEAIRSQIERIEHEMREVAAGVCPLVVVEGIINKVCYQANREEAAEHQELLLAELEKRDRDILRATEFDTKQRHRLQMLFAQDRERRAKNVKGERYLNLDKSAFQSLQRLVPPVFEQIRKRVATLRDERMHLREQALRVEETLSRVPDEAAVAQASDQLKQAQHELLKKQLENNRLQESIEIVRRKIVGEEQSITTALEKNAQQSALQDDGTRKIRFAAKVRETMKKFRRRVLHKKIEQIERLILESFRQLLRKKDFVGSIKIDPTTYRMMLFSENGQELHTDRLSAGERQLLAVSTLWGLARASGRPLPTIIDTPLGRLDSLHRSNLVENYFPYASHQVIILSTDEEIGSKHLAALKPYIARTFEISYSDTTRSTMVAPGYFFN